MCIRDRSEQELAGLRKSLIAWAQVYWKDTTINSLQSVADRAQQPALTDELRKLDEAIFSNHSSVPDIDILLQLLANLRMSKRKSTSTDSLQPLYRNS